MELGYLLTKSKTCGSTQPQSVKEYAVTEIVRDPEVQTNPSRPGSPGFIER